MIAQNLVLTPLNGKFAITKSGHEVGGSFCCVANFLYLCFVLLLCFGYEEVLFDISLGDGVARGCGVLGA
jgi:hypothetical protein